MVLRRCRAAAAGLLVAAAAPVFAGDAGALVAAAASLRHALTEVAGAYHEAGGAPSPRLSFGSSGNLYRQIRQGAPYELFLSADERYVRDLEAAGLTRGAGVTYGLGRLALVVRRGSPLRADASLDDLAAALADGRLRRFAIANPEHAPYGAAARDVLERRGLWAALRGRLVVGENVAQAMQFALSPGADGGIVAEALTRVPAVRARAEAVLLPAAWHRPLRQQMVRLAHGGGEAERFWRYLQGPAARAILARHGFSPGPAPAA